MRLPFRPAARRCLRRPPVLLAALAVSLLAASAAAHAQPGADEHAGHAHRPAPKRKDHHPQARPGVTAARVLEGAVVPCEARDAYAVAARIPHVLDAVFCHCDCHARDGRRSLLECFEENGMAATCGICLAQARMAGELHAEGRSLDEIRGAMDQRWGG